MLACKTHKWTFIRGEVTVLKFLKTTNLKKKKIYNPKKRHKFK